MDFDGDGKLNIPEIQNLIKKFQDDYQWFSILRLPTDLINQILQLKYNDHGGFLNFDQFYRMSKQKERSTFSRIVEKYCQLVVPMPLSHDQEEEDELELGNLFISFNTEIAIFNILAFKCVP